MINIMAMGRVVLVSLICICFSLTVLSGNTGKLNKCLRVLPLFDCNNLEVHYLPQIPLQARNVSRWKIDSSIWRETESRELLLNITLPIVSYSRESHSKQTSASALCAATVRATTKCDYRKEFIANITFSWKSLEHGGSAEVTFCHLHNDNRDIGDFSCLKSK